LRWINTLLGNPKTSFCGTFHAFRFDKDVGRYLDSLCFRLNHRFLVVDMTDRIAMRSAGAYLSQNEISGSQNFMVYQNLNCNTGALSSSD
jgi:hypothetical protein